jgi:hypothetical protein
VNAGHGKIKMPWPCRPCTKSTLGQVVHAGASQVAAAAAAVLFRAMVLPTPYVLALLYVWFKYYMECWRKSFACCSDGGTCVCHDGISHGGQQRFKKLGEFCVHTALVCIR